MRLSLPTWGTWGSGMKRRCRKLFLRQEPAVGHPFLETRSPCADRFLVRRAQTEAVTARRVDVQFRGHAGAFETQISFRESFRNIFSIRVRAREEHWRKSIRRLNV